MEHCRQTLTLNLARASGMFPQTSFCPRHSPSGRETERGLKQKRGTGEENRSHESETEEEWSNRGQHHMKLVYIFRGIKAKRVMEQSYHPQAKGQTLSSCHSPLCLASTHRVNLWQNCHDVSAQHLPSLPEDVPGKGIPLLCT